MTGSAQVSIAALRASHERLRALVEPMDEAALLAPSAHDWSIAEVLSHLGSQAEILGTFFDAIVAGEPVPGFEIAQPIWDAWNAKSPVAQRDDSLAANEKQIRAIEALDPAAAEAFRMDFIGRQLDLTGYVGIRLNEHAVHAWDVEVALDPAATIAPSAVAILVDGVGAVAARAGKGSPEPYSVRVGTTDPARDLVVNVGEQVSIEAADADARYDGAIDLPAEAFVRLVFGRLDPDHTPEHSESGARGVADLRAVFPGF
jgi:uncharacterized protein (TIGR03083 family)